MSDPIVIVIALIMGGLIGGLLYKSMSRQQDTYAAIELEKERQDRGELESTLRQTKQEVARLSRENKHISGTLTQTTQRNEQLSNTLTQENQDRETLEKGSRKRTQELRETGTCRSSDTTGSRTALSRKRTIGIFRHIRLSYPSQRAVFRKTPKNRHPKTRLSSRVTRGCQNVMA